MVTEARQSRSAEINQRERRYLVMMGIRVLCFMVSILMFVNHLGWIALIPAAGAILLPYFAVVVANARQVSSGGGGFRPYQPRLPERYDPSAAGQAGAAGSGQPGGGQPGGGQSGGPVAPTAPPAGPTTPPAGGPGAASA